MRSTTYVFILLVLAACLTDAKRTTSFGSSRRGGYSSRSRTPAPPRRTPPPSYSKPSDNFLNAERGGSQFTPSAPKPSHTNTQFHPTASQPSQSNGPIGFEAFNNGNNKGNRPIGFDNVNSQVQNKPAGNPPPYPVGPPPVYPGSSFGSSHDHPPAYPGRPVNAPPSYQANNPHPGTGNNYPNQYNPYPGQHHSYPGQQNPYNGQYNPYPNQHSSYPGQQTFGSGNQYGIGHGSYVGSNGYNSGNPGTYSYPGNAYSGSPFGGGYNGNPHYSPYNFGYSGYPGQQNNYQKQSRFGGLPIPIPIPIPIPLGGGGLFGDHSYSHHVLDSFIKTKSANSTSVFLLNNSTVTPCTTDHRVYELMRVTVMSCTAEHCTAIKVSAHTNTTKETVHSASITMCLEKNVTVSTYGSNFVPTVSEVRSINTTLCRDVTNKTVNETLNASEGPPTTTDAITISATEVPTTTVVPTTTEVPTTTTKGDSNTTSLCETVSCWMVEMCLPAIEVVDQCNAVDCPLRRTGYKSCVNVKMCRSPTVPISTSATLNNTISKIDEYNRFSSVYYDIMNLTLISYHRPVISFNCSQDVPTPGCAPPLATTIAPCVSNNMTPTLAGAGACNNSTLS